MKLINKNLQLEIDETNMEPISLKLDDVEFLYQQTASWKKTFPTLFPICGTLINDQFTDSGKTYTLKRHGFFREISNWILVEQSSTKAKFQFNSKKQFLAAYPWEFALTYEFNLKDDRLIITTTVTNVDEKPMYYNLGYHPGFQTKNNGTISFDQEQMLYSDAVDLKYLVSAPTQGIKIDNTLVKDLDFSGSQFFATTNNQAKSVHYVDDEKGFEINLTSYLNKTFILWSESNEAGYVCFEPMIGHSDFADRQNQEISQKDQIICLEPNQTQMHHFEIKLFLQAKKNKTEN